LKENFVFEQKFPDIKPPETTRANTRYGDCLVVAGSESFAPVTVLTTAAAQLNPTQPGDIIYTLPVNPSLLLGSRLALLAQNYERWYPTRIALEFIPEGSALNSGAVISIPVLDPSDSFIGSEGTDAVRRAMAYNKSHSFNIYDKPQLLFPEVEYDEPFFIVAGNDARLEISHMWYLMAQSTFAPTSTEVARTIGWLKLHYVIELYDEKVPEITNPERRAFTISAQNNSLFGLERDVGDVVVGNVDLFYPDHTQVYYRVTIAASVTETTTMAIMDTADSTTSFLWDVGRIFYMRLEHDFTPEFRFYSNFSDLFSANNPLTFAFDSTAITPMTGLLILEALTI
jgi:hypothetical protein